MRCYRSTFSPKIIRERTVFRICHCEPSAHTGCGNPFLFRRFSGGITFLEKEVAPKATEDGLPQSVFAEDLLLSGCFLPGD